MVKKMLSHNPKDRPPILKVLQVIKEVRKDLGIKDNNDNDFNPYEAEENIFEEEKMEKIFDIIEKKSLDTYTVMLGQLKDGQSLQTYKIIEVKFKSVDLGDDIYIELFKLSRIKHKNVIRLAKFFKFGTIDTTIQLGIPYFSKSLTSLLQDRKQEKVNFNNSSSLLNNEVSNLRGNSFEIEHLAEICLEIAEGMKGLHDAKYYFPTGHFSTDYIYIKNERNIFIDIWSPKIIQTTNLEQVKEVKPSLESDITSLGILFFELYTFITYNPVKDVKQPLKEVIPYNRRLSKMIGRMIDPKEKTLSIEEIIRKLKLIKENPHNEEEKDKIHRLKRKSKEFFTGITNLIFSPRTEKDTDNNAEGKRRKSVDFGNIFKK